MTPYIQQSRIPSVNAQVSSPSLQQRCILTKLPQTAALTSYDICIIGSGILGSSLAHSLAKSGRSILLLERDLTEPDRIVGELLQPGGCIALKKLGIESALEGIDATRVEGYKVFWGEDTVDLPYPVETTSMAWTEAGGVSKREEGILQEGRSFHHGRFVMNLRKEAQRTEGVTLVEATVNELTEDGEGRIIGVSATPKRTEELIGWDGEPILYSAKVTLVTDGCFSKFRKDFLPGHVKPIVRSNFVSLELIDPVLPAPNHGHVILRKPTLPALDADGNEILTTEKGVGPVLVYQLAEHETRMLIDVPGIKLPSIGNGDLKRYLEKHVAPILPSSILPSFELALESASAPGSRIRSMPNSYLAATPQGRKRVGAFLAGDSMNMRHPLTGGGMTVALNDCVLLTTLLGGPLPVHSVLPDSRGVLDLKEWELVRERLEEWHWQRKGIATCINTLAQALYSLFGADDEKLEVLKTGCFKYFELGGDCIKGPVSLLSSSPLNHY